MRTKIFATLNALLALAGSLWAGPLGTAFTYQGKLTDGGQPAQGAYDLRFTIYDALAGGNVVVGPLTNSPVAVTNGLFAVTLDFGAVFDGNARWLQIGVRTNGSAGDFATLSPRQPLTPSPYALYAPSAGAAATATTAGSANAVAAANITGTLGLGQLPAEVVTNNQTNVTLSGAFTGNGGGLTDLSLTSGKLTNVTMYTVPSGNIITHTNYQNLGHTNIFGQLLDIASGTNAGGTQIRFSQNLADGKYGELFINPMHDPGGPSPQSTEWQLTVPRHFGMGVGWGSTNGAHIQVGIGGAQWMPAGNSNGYCWIWVQGSGPHYSAWDGVDTKTSFSIPLTFEADGYFSALTGKERLAFPGIMSQYRTVTTNANDLGIYELDIFADLGNCPGNPGHTWNEFSDIFNPSTIRHQIRNFSGDHQGTKVIGGVSNNKTNDTIYTSTKVLDFADFHVRDFTAAINTITLSTTNTLDAVLGSDTYSKAIFFIRANGLDRTVSYPSGWCTNGFGLPATIPAGNMLRLELEWLYPGGETNIIVNSALVYQDNTFHWDNNATSFLGRLGAQPASLSNAINNFVISLKADGTWTNFDAIYPFVGAAETNAQNLVSTSYRIGWHGTFLTNDVTGITPNGTNAYGDTGWQPTNNGGGAGAFCWIASDESSSGDYRFMLGAIDNGWSECFFLESDATFVALTVNETGLLTLFAPTLPAGIYIGRNSTAIRHAFIGMTHYAFPCTAVTAPAKNAYIGAVNVYGTASYFWRGRLQMVALGRGDISASQYATLYTACQKLNAALGR